MTKMGMTFSGKQTRRNLSAWVALAFLLVWALFTHTHVGSFNDRSRMAAVESLVHRGTWVIDESPFSRTVDRIFVDGHFYSDKPPVLTFVASGVYTVLHRGFHLTLDAGWCDMDESPCHCRALCDDHPDWAYFLLTLTLVGIPAALMLALFYHMTGLLGLDNPSALLLTATLGLATQVLPYSTVFNSHIPATTSLLAGFYALLRSQRESPTDRNPASFHRREGRWLFVSGLLSGLAFTFDLGTGLFFIAFLVYAARETLAPGERSGPRDTLGQMVRRLPWPFLLGGLLPIALMVILDYQIVGNPLPPYMYTPGYDYPGSRFPQTIAGNRSPDNVLLYGLRLLFGDHGLFALNPVLLWAIVALVKTWRDRSNPLRSAAVLIGATSGMFALYFITFTDNFGGAAYGPRWYTVFIPLLFLFIAARWTEMRTRARWLLFLALATLSFANSYAGALNPWRTTTPLLWLEHARPEQSEPVDVALSGITYEEVEPDLLAAFENRRVDKRWFDARSCLVVPPGQTWLFVEPGTPLDPALAERTHLPTGGRLACSVDLASAWDACREQMDTAAWSSPIIAPTDSDPRTAVPLPASFGGQFALVGYEWLGGEASAGADVTLITAWRIESKPEPPLSIFVHLLDPQGRIVGQSDGLGANPDGLFPGDGLLHVHRFTIASGVPPGRYWLQAGVYNPQTMARLPLVGHDSDRLLLAQVELTGP